MNLYETVNALGLHEIPLLLKFGIVVVAGVVGGFLGWIGAGD